MKFKDYIANVNRANTLINALERSSKHVDPRALQKVQRELHKTAFHKEERKIEKGHHAPSAHALQASDEKTEVGDADDNQSSSRQSEEEVAVLEDRLEGNLLDDKYKDLKQLLKQQ